MLFDTPVYFLFLALVVIAYWRLERTRQNWLLLAASYLFYGWWDWRFLLLMMGSTLVDYLVAKKIAGTENPARRRAWLILSLTVNFGCLGVFKYFNFFADSLMRTLHLMGMETTLTAPFFQIILPPGISFYTFQEVAYIVDVYFRKLEPADSVVDYALFVSLFPHLIAGPIQRPSHLLPQVQHARSYNSEAFFDGCMLIASGLFRKCVIADRCAIIANAGFSGQFGHSFAATALATLAFAFQIYGDFSGYSDFARGSAQLLGFHFMVNFRQPYLAASLQDFWRRWHVSLSTWLRDYLYIPLGGSRKGELKTYRNLMATMLLGGLWHGANWTFVIWGGLHGAGLSVERVLFRESTPQPPRGFSLWARRVFVFALVCLAWIFFRADSLHAAFRMIADLRVWAWEPQFGTTFLVLAFLIAITLAIDLRMDGHEEEYPFQKTPAMRRVVFAVALLAVVTMFSATQSNAFIYFQF
jgi:D-alanyl-lipoteichoic acid acyltransferase DltB (MBOAT superfamily)